MMMVVVMDVIVTRDVTVLLFFLYSLGKRLASLYGGDDACFLIIQTLCSDACVLGRDKTH